MSDIDKTGRDVDAHFEYSLVFDAGSSSLFLVGVGGGGGVAYDLSDNGHFGRTAYSLDVQSRAARRRSVVYGSARGVVVGVDTGSRGSRGGGSNGTTIHTIHTRRVFDHNSLITWHCGGL